jgi:ubiquinone/menaquinone biosynthesis C-methylase UbiE
MLITRFMRWFFKGLYHPFAFSYDWVAALVSLGHWNDWGRMVLPFLNGTKVLELGHGPGYLQVSLRASGIRSCALDESRQMGRLAKRRLQQRGYAEVNLTCGMAQRLPFMSEYFDSLVSTFPSEYIFDSETLAETRRVLVPGGRLVVLPLAWPASRVLRWIFRVTGEAPAQALEIIEEKLREPFVEAGFRVDIKTIEAQQGVVLIATATKERE